MKKYICIFMVLFLFGANFALAEETTVQGSKTLTASVAPTVPATPLSIDEINKQLVEIGDRVTPRSVGNVWGQYGHAERMDSGGKGSNNFASGMAEYRPFGWEKSDGRLDLGIYARLELGSGKAGKKTQSRYDWLKYGGGLNMKYWSKNAWDLNTRLGLRQERNKASGSTQNTTSVEAAANLHIEQGRLAKRGYATEADIFAQVVVPVVSEKRSDTGAKLTADQKRSTDLKAQVGITDFKISKTDMLVPIIGAGVGTAGDGAKEMGKVNYQLSLKWRHNGYDRLTAKVENEHIGSRMNTTGTIQISWEF